ncbi:MAG: helix-turn-helix transcriptional regulator [Abitibacteriaceae bacterium]|nr:helix-turn-helix transcriptional regulator [Abditibacteriaceae bacterium]MBV9867422.1 helix-turn-helix transcriptional regulator [Abditibacteriaceae bacterium]
MPDTTDTIFRGIFLSFMRVHVLYHAAQAPIYGVEMTQELARHGYEVSPGTLYPLLHGLEKAEYLVSAEQVVEGKVRKYYSITPAGRKALKNLKPKIRELVNEVLI